MGNFSLRIRSVTLEKEIVGICGRLHRSYYFFDCICHRWMATATGVYNRSANQRMTPSLQSRCGRHSCAMQQRVVPRGLIRGSLGLNPPAHPIILTGAKQAAEPPPRRAAEAQHNQGRPVPVGRYSRQRGLQRRRQAGMPSSTRVRTPAVRSLGTPHSPVVGRR